ncbi:MAG: YceI family protein [Myxococcales bacterium]|nr:YceI family protein [Myxococcales bacterium]
MPTLDASLAECRIFTFKEGMLSAVAHDLELDVTRFTIQIEGQIDGQAKGQAKVSARFETGSLRVLHAMRDGQATSQLSAGDRAKIEKTMADEVLEVRRYPDVRFDATATAAGEGEGEGFALAGELVVHGKARPLTVRARPQAGRLVAEVSLHQPDFGIKPYSAMLGALKVRPDVKVRISVPWPLPT